MKNLKNIAIIGLGGLGIPVLLRLLNDPQELEIHIFEDDVVELSNLHRQIIFTKDDIDSKKLEVLKSTLNSEPYRQTVKSKSVSLYDNKVTLENISQLQNIELIIDCTDDPKFKFALSDYCKLSNKILIHGGAQGEQAFIFTIHPEGPCLRCLFGSSDSVNLDEVCKSCRISGILGAYSGLAGIYQAELALAVINGDTKSYAVKIDPRGSKSIQVQIDPNCPVCSKHNNLNLREISCPETFVYTKLSLLKRENPAENILIHFKGEEELHSVQKSVLEEGFNVISQITQKELGIFRLLVK